MEREEFDDEYFHQELRREVREEANIEITNIKNIIPCYRKKSRIGSAEKDGEVIEYVFLEYLCVYAGGVPTPGDDIVEIQWFNKAQIKNIPVTKPSKEMYEELGW